VTSLLELTVVSVLFNKSLFLEKKYVSKEAVAIIKMKNINRTLFTSFKLYFKIDAFVKI